MGKRRKKNPFQSTERLFLPISPFFFFQMSPALKQTIHCRKWSVNAASRHFEATAVSIDKISSPECTSSTWSWKHLLSEEGHDPLFSDFEVVSHMAQKEFLKSSEIKVQHNHCATNGFCKKAYLSLCTKLHKWVWKPSPHFSKDKCKEMGRCRPGQPGLLDPRGAGSVPMAQGGSGLPPPPTSTSRPGAAGTCTGDLHHSTKTRVPRMPFHNIYINCFANCFVGITTASDYTVLGLLQHRLRHLPIVQYSFLCLLTNLF